MKTSYKKLWFLIVPWMAMAGYIIFAPDLFVAFLTKYGKPIQPDRSELVESDQITLLIEGLDPYIKDGENVVNLYGWSVFIPPDGLSMDLFAREIVLLSDKRSYFFSTQPIYRAPELPRELAEATIDRETLGFNALIAEDVLRPGKYRIGVVFRNTSDGSAFYWDKPACYLIKTPNTVQLEKK